MIDKTNFDKTNAWPFVEAKKIAFADRAKYYADPDFNKIPEPGSLSKNKEDESEDRIKKILKAPSTNDTKENNSSSVEDTIIDRIRK